MVKPVTRIQRRQIITARQLNEYGDGINELNKESAGKPKQTEDVPDPAVQAAAEEESGEIEGDNIYTETSRTISQVQVFDQDETNYALVDRMETVIVENSKGETFKFIFNNPD